MSALISACIVIVGLIGLATYHLRRWNLYRAAAKLPGPMVLPLIGNAYYCLGSTTDFLNNVMDILRQYPSPSRVWLGPKLLIALSDPEQIKTVLHSPKAIEKDEVYRFIRPWVGTGLFSAPAAKWKIHRKLIMPTFNPRILESFVEVFVRQSEIMTKQMEVDFGRDLYVFNYVSLCTLDIICETAMGVPGKVQTERDLTYVNAAKRALEIIYQRMFKVWLHSDFIFNCTSLAKEQKKCVQVLHEQTNCVIKEHRMLGDSQGGKPAASRKAFLDFLMELTNDGRKLTDEELREEVDTMMLAGNDTTATVNTFVIFMLANFPIIQEKCYQELLDIYGDKIGSDTPIVYADLRRMEYLERVIKETMRLFPVGPLIVRKVSEDLNIGNCIMPAGCSALIAIILLHRRPDIWDQPLEFNPDRFLPEHVAQRHPYAFIPFSAGPRNCLGLKYAMMGMKVLIATLLRRYILKKDHFVKIEDIKLKADLVLKPAVPITVRIERRAPMCGHH